MEARSLDLEIPAMVGGRRHVLQNLACMAVHSEERLMPPN
jgi:hypothetical protein